MRTLLVDNYDSFTYNLFDLIAQVNGRDPDVIPNDAPMPGPHDLLETYDNIIVSPGPGTPCRDLDLGSWGEVFGYPDIPVLGVCLGHQAICHFHGAAVGAAPEPRHGRPSAIDHVGTGLFTGIPSPFTAIRYHSLAVSDLPDTMESIAWSEDGVVMGIRHLKLPQWGVQFHPESIGTEHGYRLIHNFAELTADRRGSSGRRRGAASVSRRFPPTGQKPGPEPFSSHAPSGRNPRNHTHRVLYRTFPTVIDAEVLFAGLFGESSHAFWLDSSGGGRFSFMGDATGPDAVVACADVHAATVTLTKANEERIRHGGFFDWLGEDLAGRVAEMPDELPFDFGLGWVGYLGYELKAECGGNPANRSALPDAALLFVDRAVAVDHEEGQLYLLALVPAGRERDADGWFAQMASYIADLQPPHSVNSPAEETTHGVRTTARHDATSYIRLIAECKDELGRGETYEVCLTNALSAKISMDGWNSYRRLRALSPAPYAAYLKFGDVQVLSTSPERFLKISADGTMESKPIKGTRPRGCDDEEDDALASDLRTNPKDRAENMMIVDLVRNDLARTAEAGSVHVPHLFEVESYATVHQLVSTVRARKRADVSPVEAVRRAFPGGSMTGAPKIRTMQIIDRLEGGARGVYSGAIGFFSVSGAVDLGMTIRTVVISPGEATYGVGGAIIVLSDPEAEVEETRTKAAVFARLLNCSSADLIPGPR